MMTEFLDSPPDSPAITDYDRQHLKLYLRLLDAESEGADWRDVAPILFRIDVTTQPDRARLLCDSHLARARWITQNGYQDLLKPDA